MSPDKDIAGRNREWKWEAQGPESQLKCHILDLKASMSSLKETFISYSCRAKMLKTEPRISSCKLLDYNATQCNYYDVNWIPSFIGLNTLLLKWGYGWEGMGLWKLGRGYVGRPWWSWILWALKFWWIFFPSWMVSLLPFEGIDPALLKETALAFPEAVVLQDTATSPQDLLQLPLCF